MEDGVRGGEDEPKRRGELGRGRAKRLRRVLVLVVAVVVLGGTGLGVLSATGWLESLLFYFPRGGGFENPPGVEDVYFPSRDEGIMLHGWFIPAEGTPPGETAPTVLHVHGNAFHVGRHIALCEWLADEGFNVLLFDYRGYGRSNPGRRLREGLVADTHGAIDYLLTREDVDPDRIGMFGFSMGGTIGLAAAGEREEIRAVVASSTFSTWKGVTGDHAGAWARVLIPAGRDAADSVGALGSRPLLITHGDADLVVDVRHAALLGEAARAAGVDVEVRTVPGAGHVGSLEDPGTREAIAGFLREALRDEGGGASTAEDVAPFTEMMGR